MTQPQIVEKTALSLAEVKNRLKDIHKRDEELTFRGGKTEDYINEVSHISEKKSKDAIKKIESLDISRLKGEPVIKIIDILPTSAEHLKVILSGFNITLKKEDMEKVVNALDEFRPVK